MGVISGLPDFTGEVDDLDEIDCHGTGAVEELWTKTVPEDLDPESHLRRLVENNEPMIFLYGQNPHLCFIRTHCSKDTGKSYPIMRKTALEILKDRYFYRSQHISADKQRAKVYSPKTGPRSKP